LDKRNGKWGISNHDQPKDAEVKVKVVQAMVALLGTKYDYPAYLKIAMDTVGITPYWTDWNDNDVPTSYICSAVADQIYEQYCLPNPGGMKVTRFTTPAEWAEFIDKRQWEKA
jgi:hypothetical protein